MVYFQSILALYESTTEEKQEIVVNQLVTFTDTNKQHESFFQFLFEKMENPNSLSLPTMKSILNISIDFLNSQSPQFSISNIKQYVQFLLRLFSLKVQPNSYSKYNSFLKSSFRLINQYNQESLFSTLARIPYEQSIIPLSVLCIQNSYFFDRILEIIDNSFNSFKKDQKLSIWTIAMTNLLQNIDNNHKNDANNAVDKSISLMLNKVFVNKFLSLDYKFNLFEAALTYMPTKLGDDMLSSHCLNLLSSVSISSSIDEIIVAVNFAKTVLIRLKSSEIKNLTPNQLVDSVFTYVLPGYRSGQSLNASLTNFFNESDKDYLQSKITAEIRSDNVTLSTLFLISRFPTPKTIPHLLTRARVDQKSQYILIFYFLSHNLVPFRYLPRLFSLLEPEDLHFLNEIFEQKPILYCTAAIKFLSQCKRIEKIEFIANLFSSSKSVPIINSPYAKSAFIVVACLRAQSKAAGCPIRLLLDYLHSCINTTKSQQKKEKKEIKTDEIIIEEEEEVGSDSDNQPQNGEIADDKDDDVNINNNEKESLNIKNDELETAQVKTSEISSSLSSFDAIDKLDLTNEDIASITESSKENLKEKVQNYNVKKAIEELNKPTFCQSQAIQSIANNDPELKESFINEALDKIKEGEIIFTIIIGSITDNQVLIHNCVQTLAQSDLFLLTFFFTTSASCYPELILKEMQEYILNDPEAAPQSFVARLFSSRTSNQSRRQRIVRRCIIGMSPFVPFSSTLYKTLLASFPTESLQQAHTQTEMIVNKISSPLVCESIISVCNYMKNKEDLQLILQNLCYKADSFDPILFVQALICILKSNKELSNKNALLVIKIWLNLLISNKIDLSSQKDKQSFESVLLSNNNNAKSIYIKEIEEAIRNNCHNSSLFLSLKSAIPFIKDFNLSKQPSFLTLIISNTLSNNEIILQICVNLLRETFQMTCILNPLKTTVFSNEYVESVRRFYTELSTKFQSKQLMQLVEALLSYYKEKQPNHQEAVLLFTVFAVLKQPLLFVQNKFVSKIASACDKLTKKNDYAIIFYLCRSFDSMNSADKSIFFKEFIAAPENEFVSTYLEKYSTYYDFLEPFLVPKLLQLRTIDKKWRELLEFERLLKLFNGFVRLSFRNSSSSSSDKISRIIFSLLLSASTINYIRNRGFAIDSYLTIIDQCFCEFKNSTGLCLINTTNIISGNYQFLLKSDNDFYEFVFFFALSFQYLQNEVVNNLLSMIDTLSSTIHIDCALLCLSSYLVTVSNSVSDDTKRLKNKAVDLFTSFLKNSKFDSSLISFVISRVPAAFSVASLKQMNASYLTIILKLAIESSTKAVDPTQPLELVLNIVRSSTPSFIGQFVPQIIECLRSIVSNGKIKLSSILILNIVGEIGRRKQDPSSLLKNGSSVSFRSLVPLLISEDIEIKARVDAIFSLMIFGKAQQNPDFELIFTSLMSIFVGYENDTASFVEVALDLLKAVEKCQIVNVDKLRLLKFAFQPVLSVGDVNCNAAIDDLLKFLKKLSDSVEDNELFTFVLDMMTLFARPKRNFSLTSK